MGLFFILAARPAGALRRWFVGMLTLIVCVPRPGQQAALTERSRLIIRRTSGCVGPGLSRPAASD
jgi:hypothetical protein